MKKTCIFFLLLLSIVFVRGQYRQPTAAQRKAITLLIDQYSLVRETRDTILLKKILTSDIDQLVSTGEWREGIASAVNGMMKSSAGNPGNRNLAVDKVRLLTPACALVDCRYEITNVNGDVRKMWSSFVMVEVNGVWKISAIRNMLPAER